MNISQLPPLIERIIDRSGIRQEKFDENKLSKLIGALVYCGVDCELVYRHVTFNNSCLDGWLGEDTQWALKTNGQAYDLNGVAGWDNILQGKGAQEKMSSTGFSDGEWDGEETTKATLAPDQTEASRVLVDLIRHEMARELRGALSSHVEEHDDAKISTKPRML